MNGDPIRVYADTSVFGGVFDEEFNKASRTFFDEVVAGRFLLVTSDLVESEVEDAPIEVQRLFAEMQSLGESTRISVEALQLRGAYLEAGIVGPRRALDALHVALATVAKCALIVSWNFKHIVHFQKVPLYNAVNVLEGYAEIAVYSPPEVIEDDEEEEEV